MITRPSRTYLRLVSFKFETYLTFGFWLVLIYLFKADVFMWGFGWGKLRWSWRGGRRMWLQLAAPSPYRLDETERKGSRHPRSD